MLHILRFQLYLKFDGLQVILPNFENLAFNLEALINQKTSVSRFQ